MTAILKGKTEKREATKANLEEELKNLLNNEISIVTLENDEGFLQSILQKEGGAHFRIEVQQDENLYYHKKISP